MGKIPRADDGKARKKRTRAPAKRTRTAAPAEPQYVLRLYVTGMTPRSVLAIRNLKKICEEHLHGRYRLEVIDIYQQPTLARGEQIVAVPTLIKKLPTPLRRFVGDMSDLDKVLLGLDVRPRT